MNQTLFHPGERAAQALAGAVSPQAAIRDWMPDQHRAFFALLPFLPIATVDGQGAPVATVLTGAPGFISSPDPNTLRIACEFDQRDPAAACFLPGAPVGILGIDLATRRRNRANGVVQSIESEAVTVHVTQSFGNCPQFIQTRTWHDEPRTPGVVEPLSGLDPAARAMIAASDTFFVASSACGGVDMSHRGGLPGFVAINEDTLTVPDFRGNHYFNTLGNLLLNPRAALLFIDWTSGTLLHVAGRADIVWDEGAALAGAERLWRLSVTGGWRRPGALPLRWSFGEFARQTLQTGTWARVDGPD